MNVNEILSADLRNELYSQKEYRLFGSDGALIDVNLGKEKDSGRSRI